MVPSPLAGEGQGEGEQKTLSGIMVLCIDGGYIVLCIDGGYIPLTPCPLPSRERGSRSKHPK